MAVFLFSGGKAIFGAHGGTHSKGQLDPVTSLDLSQNYKGDFADVESLLVGLSVDFSWTGAETVLPLDAVYWDEKSNWDTVNYRFTCPRAGKYLGVVQCRYSNTTSGTSHQVRIRVNGTAMIWHAEYAVGAFHWQVAVGFLDLALNDTVDLTVYHSGTASIVVNAGQSGTYFGLFRLY